MFDFRCVNNSFALRNVNARVFTNKSGRTDSGQRPILKPQLSNQFHDDMAKYVTSILFDHKVSLYSHIRKTAPPPWQPYIYIKPIFSPSFMMIGQKIKLPPPGSHVIQLTGTIFQLNSRIKETNVLTKFHENWAKKCDF
ncbi:hypothetical protein DPMN_116838 [Dreissena polymorpha]|uniref:Uncharacterized protein n=1 Tax=Dreissena polymorpha TaxID=45954 RepID=A0A9D4KPJ0_DREPO|nr:hypothetical protein DPMN_116838 [Dreissena polymorpha]